MATRIYDQAVFGDDLTLGINWGPIIGQGVGAGVSTGLQALFGPKQQRPHPLTDSGEMAAALDQMWLQTWQPATQQLAPADQLQLANQIRAWLYDPSAFGQSGTENDAYLINSKTWINTAITNLQAALAAPTPVATPTQTVINPATGQTVLASVTTTGQAQISTTALLLFAGVGLLLIVSSGR